MRATRPALLAVGLLAALTGGAGQAFANAGDLVDAMRLDLAASAPATTPSDRVLPPTDLSTLRASDIRVVDAAQAVRGKDPDVKCIKVTGIRPWHRAKRRLSRLGYRQLHVVRFVPRQIKPVGASKSRATCAGGWFLVRATKGRIRYRVALDAATLKVSAKVRR